MVDQQWSRLEGCKRTETEGSAPGKRVDLRAAWMTTLSDADKGPYAVILAPTRELVQQVSWSIRP